MDIEAWVRGLGLELYAQAFRDNAIEVERLKAALEDIARGLCSASGAASTAREALDGEKE